MFIIKFNFTSFTEAATAWQKSFQNPATPIMEGILNFHNDLMFFGLVIFVFVGYLVIYSINWFDEKKNIKASNIIHGTFIEIIWTVVPAIILMFIAIPSFVLTYSIDEIIDSQFTVKIMGHQWYWSYEYAIDVNNIIKSKMSKIVSVKKPNLQITLNESFKDSFYFDSYMLPQEDLQKGQLRLLEVDHPLILPTKTHIKLLIGSTDVIHSWAIPSFGIKLDACPGRLNQTSLYIKRIGSYYGQCSEICGINHGFMPINIIAIPFKEWIKFTLERHTDIIRPQFIELLESYKKINLPVSKGVIHTRFFPSGKISSDKIFAQKFCELVESMIIAQSKACPSGKISFDKSFPQKFCELVESMIAQSKACPSDKKIDDNIRIYSKITKIIHKIMNPKV